MKNLELVMGNRNYSSWSLRPWFWLRHNDISFIEKIIGLSMPDTAEHIEQIGAGRSVPVLIDGDIRIWDSLAILEYLAEKYPLKKAWPDDPAARAYARSVSAEMHSSFFALRNEMPMNCRRIIDNFPVSAAVQADVNRVKQLWVQCREKYGANGPWLFGEFSIADAMYAPVVMRFNTYGVCCDGVAGYYMETVLQQQAISEWLAASRLEQATIVAAEL